MGKAKDIKGERYERLVALRPVGSGHSGVKWECECDCGNFCIAYGRSLWDKRKTSCGCRRSEQSRANLLGKAGAGRVEGDLGPARRVLRGYRRQAKRRALAWDLTEEQGLALLRLNCTYCGRPPHQRQRSEQRIKPTDLFFTGIDRMDNSLGYTPENVTPCCGTCNRAKMAQGFGEFTEWVTRVYWNLRCTGIIQV